MKVVQRTIFYGLLWLDYVGAAELNMNVISVSKPEVSATFSIVGVDPSTGQCGATVASKYPAVGRVVPYVRAGVGAFCTQHYHVPEWGPRALDLLQTELSPQAVIAQLLRDDPQAEQRQLALIACNGQAAQHHPTQAPSASHYWGGMAGCHYCCQGNTLVGRAVILAMAAAFEETPGSLADRLMAALVAGDCAGGDHRGRLAAGLRVTQRGQPDDWLSLDVDESDDAVIDLLRRYAELQHAAKGDWRGGQLPFVHPCPARGPTSDGKTMGKSHCSLPSSPAAGTGYR